MATLVQVLSHVVTILLLMSCLITAVHCRRDELLAEYDICNPKTQIMQPASVFLKGPSDNDRDGQSTTVYVNWTWPAKNPSIDSGCLMFFKTDHTCQIRVEAVSPEFRYPSCSQRGVLSQEESEIDSCLPGCVYIKLVDSDYKAQTLKYVTSSASVQTFPPYQSQSSKLHVVACNRGLSKIPGSVNMRLRLRTVLKHRSIQGYVGVTTISSQTLTSPYFPNPYMQNSELYNYTFNGMPGSGASVIAVTFDDWYISQSSEIVFNVNGRQTKLSGRDRRPYFIANSRTMQMTFNTGRQLVAGGYYSFLGFKAIAKFYRDIDDVPKYVTDCDKTIDEGPGGVIIQNRFTDGRARDCIWIIKPTRGVSSVYLKVLRYTHGWTSWSNGLIENSLEVRAGITSEAPQRMLLTPSQDKIPDYSGQISQGFYIRLKGIYADNQPVIIAYSHFQMECSSRYEYDTYFRCDNGRCIDKVLRCDNYDHCGDNADELYCNGNDPNEVNKHEGGHNYNYSISVGVIIPMVVVVFLIIVVCLLVIFFKRIRRLRQRNANTSGNSGSGLLGGRDGREGHRGGERGQRRGRDRRRRHRGNTLNPLGGSSSHLDYPPSYDEAMISTPVEMLNMAFPWSHSDLGQPPSYEDVLMEASESSALRSPAAPPYQGSNINNNNNIINLNNNINSHQSRSDSVPSISTTTASGVYPVIQCPRLTTGSALDNLIDGQSGQRQSTSISSNLNSNIILDPNLAPGAYVSSSSSSEASETEAQMDMSSSSESSTDNEQGFIPSRTQAPRFACGVQHSDDNQELRQQIPAYSNRRSSSASIMGGIPATSEQGSGQKIAGQEDGEQPIVVKVHNTANKKNQDPSKETESIREDKDGRGLLNENAENINVINEHFESPVTQNQNDSRDPIDISACGQRSENENSSLKELAPTEAQSASSYSKDQQRNWKRGGKKRHGRRHSRNASRVEDTAESNDGRRGHPTSDNDSRLNNSGQGHRLRRALLGASCETTIEEYHDDPHQSDQRDHVRMNDGVKSQSCFNLNFAGADRSADRYEASVGDKRFSYAGAGDVMVRSRQNQQSQLPLSHKLARDVGRNRLDRFNFARYESISGATGAESLHNSTSTCQETSNSVSKIKSPRASIDDMKSSNRSNQMLSNDQLLTSHDLDNPHMKYCVEDGADLAGLNVNAGPISQEITQMHMVSRSVKRSSPQQRSLDPRLSNIEKNTRHDSDSTCSQRPESSYHNNHTQQHDSARVSLDNVGHDVPITHDERTNCSGRNREYFGPDLLQNEGDRRKHPSSSRQIASQRDNEGFEDRKNKIPNFGMEGKHRPQVPKAMSSSEIANIYAKRRSPENFGERPTDVRNALYHRQKDFGDNNHQNGSHRHAKPQPTTKAKESCQQTGVQGVISNPLPILSQGPDLSIDPSSHRSPSGHDPCLQQLQKFSSTAEAEPFHKRPNIESYINPGVMTDTPIACNTGADNISVLELAGSSKPHRNSRDRGFTHKNPSGGTDSGGNGDADANKHKNADHKVHKAISSDAQPSHRVLPQSDYFVQRSAARPYSTAANIEHASRIPPNTESHKKMAIHTEKSGNRHDGPRPSHKRDHFIHHPRQHTPVTGVSVDQQKLEDDTSHRGRPQRPMESHPPQSELTSDGSITSCHLDMCRPGHRKISSRPATGTDTRIAAVRGAGSSRGSVMNAPANPGHQRPVSGTSVHSAEQRSDLPLDYLFLQDNKEEEDIYV